MFIGVLTVKLHIPWAHSLKDKRQVIKSLCAKARQHYNVAAAEVGAQELWQSAELCFVCVAAAMTPCQTQLDALDQQIQKWQDKMSDQIDRYTAKFSALEQLVSEMNSQSSYFAGLMGGY